MEEELGCTAYENQYEHRNELVRFEKHFVCFALFQDLQGESAQSFFDAFLLLRVSFIYNGTSYEIDADLSLNYVGVEEHRVVYTEKKQLQKMTMLIQGEQATL
jgi:hypothetical protein